MLEVLQFRFQVAGIDKRAEQSGLLHLVTNTTRGHFIEPANVVRFNSPIDSIAWLKFVTLQARQNWNSHLARSGSRRLGRM